MKFLPTSHPLLTSSSGFSLVLMILIVVIIMSIAFVSGSHVFVSTPTESVLSSQTPDGNPDSSTNPDDSTTGDNPAWDISVTLEGCQTSKGPEMLATMTITGNQNGYYAISINENGTYRQLISDSFTTPSQKDTLFLPNSSGFNSNPWQINVFSGGSQNSGTWTSGTLEKTFDGSPTGC